MRACNENANKCAIDLYTVSVRWQNVQNSLPTRRGLVVKLTHFVSTNVSVLWTFRQRTPIPCRGRAERSHSVCIACSLRTDRTSAYAENFCACIKFLGVRNELRRTSAYDTVLWTLAQPPPDVLPTCISVWQRMTKSRHTQAYAEVRVVKNLKI